MKKIGTLLLLVFVPVLFMILINFSVAKRVNLQSNLNLLLVGKYYLQFHELQNNQNDIQSNVSEKKKSLEKQIHGIKKE